jgi:hypothetical protein
MHQDRTPHWGPFFHALLITASLASAEGYHQRSKVFEFENERAGVLFHYERHDRMVDGVSSGKGEFSTPERKLVISEEFSLANNSFLRYVIDNRQTGQKHLIVKDGKKFTFSTEENGKTRVDKDEIEEDVVIGPTLFSHIQLHWDELMKDEKVKFRFVVPDRRETFGFAFKKHAEDDSTVTFSMSASSVFIAMIVRPILFTFDKAKRQAIRIVGKTSLLKETPKGLEDFKADTRIDPPT